MSCSVQNKLASEWLAIYNNILRFNCNMPSSCLQGSNRDFVKWNLSADLILLVAVLMLTPVLGAR